jgi:hypothetical protein
MTFVMGPARLKGKNEKRKKKDDVISRPSSKPDRIGKKKRGGINKHFSQTLSLSLSLEFV